jgi:hypothetical protein
MITGYCLGGSGSILALPMNEVAEADHSTFKERRCTLEEGESGRIRLITQILGFQGTVLLRFLD